MKKKSVESQNEKIISNKINWFPGHMAKALREVQAKIKIVDLILEIRDARAPLSSGNRAIHKIVGEKPRLIVLNKSNLADKRTCRIWEEWFTRSKQSVVFIDAFDSRSLQQLTIAARRIVGKKWQSFRNKGIKPPPLRMIILGIPNTGKSTIINRLTHRKAAKTGDRPGVTRTQEWIVLEKDMELLDTPGIMSPIIESQEQGMWLCAIHAIKDEIVGKDILAAYVLDYLRQRDSPQLLKKYGLQHFCSDAQELLSQIGTNLNYKKKKGEIDQAKTCNQVLKDFRQGLLGACCFESPPSSKPH